jgi:site-specific DNA-adenine methylase
MWKRSSQKGWRPPGDKVSRSLFMKLAGSGGTTAYKGFVGHVFAAMSKYFLSYDDRVTARQAQKQGERVRRVAKAMPQVVFSAGPYSQYSHLKNCVLYCDPPYHNRTSRYYGESRKRITFDTDKFVRWCAKMAARNLVIISGYDAPSSCFRQIWKARGSLKRGSINATGRERLFVFRQRAVNGR